MIHTADWHLGQRLVENERTDEHQRFLDWLIGLIQKEEVELLIVAGDIFDSAHPPQAATKMYYDFLREIVKLGGCEVVIVGGNHDSPSHLNAPSELLKTMNIHVVGCIPPDLKQAVFKVCEGRDLWNPGAVICAAPFLRDRDLRDAIAGEAIDAREERVREGIYRIYERMWAAGNRFKKKLPIIATGHLTAQGGQFSDSEREIHIGNLGAISAERLPPDFAYVALGHLHRPQTVGSAANVRYSGSPIPLSFSEADDLKQVVMLEFENGALLQMRDIGIPCSRRLLRFQGTLDEFTDWVTSLREPQEPLLPWAEVKIELECFEPGLEQRVYSIAEGSPVVILKVVEVNRARPEQTWEEVTDSLDDMDPEQVFVERLRQEDVDPETDEGEVLIETFRELITIHGERSREEEKA